MTRLPLETHLMISDPDFFLDECSEAGFGDRDGVAAAMERLRAAIDDTQGEPELAGPSASQRSR